MKVSNMKVNQMLIKFVSILFDSFIIDFKWSIVILNKLH